MVLAELWRGTTKPAERAFLQQLEKKPSRSDPDREELAGVRPDPWRRYMRTGVFFPASFATSVQVGLCDVSGGHMKEMEISKAFTLMESGPVVLVTTNDGNKNNIMTISWTMVMDFTPIFAMTTGHWNYSFAALQEIEGMCYFSSHCRHA